MEEKIKKDILAVLKATIDAIKENKHHELSELSNHVIHNASIYQDPDSLSIAVFVYALSKIISRCCELGLPIPPLLDSIQAATKLLESGQFKAYGLKIKQLLESLKALDKKMAMYIEEVLEKAKIRKGSKLHEHGLTIARTAELLGISQWQLLRYIGVTTIPETWAGMPAPERLDRARQLFGLA